MARTRFHSILRAKIEEEIEIKGASIVTGNCIDHSHYREQVGYLQGLSAALKLADDIEAQEG